jgi:hypothetical protein
MIDLVNRPSNARPPKRVTPNVAARRGKKTDKGKIMSLTESES